MIKLLFAAALAVYILSSVVLSSVGASPVSALDKPVEERTHTVQVFAFAACGLVQYYVVTLNGRTFLVRDRDLDDPQTTLFLRRIAEIMDKNKVTVQYVYLDKELPIYGIKCQTA